MGRIRKPKIRRPPRKSIPYSAIRKANRRRPRSSLEITVGGWLKEEEIPFVREKAIGRCHVDVFLPPRTIVELNGCYWHGCMICNKEPTQNQKIAQIKDGRRYAYFRNRGYDLIVIWECEVKKEPNRVRAMLKTLANQG